MVLDPNDLADVLLKFAGPGETGVRFSTDTSQALADFINGDTDGIVTFLLAASAEDDRLIIRSREHSSGGTLLESVQPVLVDPGSEGLVAYYEMDNDANDSSGNDLHGTLIGDPNFVEGVTGMALDFDGVDDYVEIQDAEELTPENFTIAFWVNPTDMDRVQITIAKRTQANVGGYSFNITSVAIGSRHWYKSMVPG